MADLTLLPLLIRALSHDATSLAKVLKSRTWLSSSSVHLFTTSSMVLPRSMDGAGTATVVGAAVAVASTDARRQ